MKKLVAIQKSGPGFAATRKTDRSQWEDPHDEPRWLGPAGVIAMCVASGLAAIVFITQIVHYLERAIVFITQIVHYLERVMS